MNYLPKKIPPVFALGLCLGLLLSQAPAATAIQGVVSEIIVGQMPQETVRVAIDDSVIFSYKVPCGPTGRYWWHFHGPGTVTKLPFKGVVEVSIRPGRICP